LQTDFATLQNVGLDFSALHGLEKKAAAGVPTLNRRLGDTKLWQVSACRGEDIPHIVGALQVKPA
jgi:hypothetical protein